jgi:RNA polymerase sigma-70 factor (ECF subfamily)
MVISQEEFLAVYRDTVERLFGVVAAKTGGDRQLAEDVVQETYLRALSGWRRNGFPNEPIAWLCTVALNLLRTHFRSLSVRERHARQAEAGPQQSSPASDVEEAVLGAALRELPEQQARLVQGHLDGKRVREMASETGLSERAVEGRLRRARMTLREKLRPLLRKEKENES